MSVKAIFVGADGAPRWPSIAAIALLLLMGIWMESCATMKGEGSSDPKRGDRMMKFSHSKHAKHAPDCKTCHVNADDGTVGKATHASCVACHAAAVDDKPADKTCLECHHTLTPAARGRGDRPDYSTANFDHAQHETVDCASCHGVLDKKKIMGGGANFPRMEECLACHAKGIGEPSQSDCALCHFGTTPQTVPKSHLQPGWKEASHGKISMDDPALCSRCHVEARDCASCHAMERPKSHNQAFRAKTHGFFAKENPMSCETCHAQDFCEACHLTTEPQNHTASFKGRPFLHCVTCHEPLNDEQTCSVCHHGEPHEDVFATPPPPDLVEYGDIDLHQPCLPCHPVHEVPIPHPYSGHDSLACIVCHKPI